MSRADDDGDNLLNFHEFANYMLEHEHNLKLVFKTIDVDKDGAITLHEIQVRRVIRFFSLLFTCSFIHSYVLSIGITSFDIFIYRGAHIKDNYTEKPDPFGQAKPFMQNLSPLASTVCSRWCLDQVFRNGVL